MLRRAVLVACLALLGCATAPPAREGSALLGFGAASGEAQRALEARFDALVSKDRLREGMLRLAARPHHLGSAYGKENAEWIAARFKEWGFETSIEEFQVLFPVPRVRIVELTAPVAFKATLDEPPLPEDLTSGQKDEQLPLYNAYSADGDASGELVYVNYGVPQDYEELERRGIDVRGKIVLARYGGSWRGIKPKAAAERGALGCLIYSDPRDDGYSQGLVYPRGPFRCACGAQRGSVMDMPLHPGDPLTPFTGSTPGAKRLELKDAPTLTKIPVLPISYQDALPLLRELGGPVAPEPWRGALPVTYRLGPGPARVRVKIECDWTTPTLYNVVARLPGRELPDSWILRGNHHDAWVNGAEDPVSGMIAVLEEARLVGELAKSGWRPRRTLVYLAWDGEEQGLLGSTEWVETHAARLGERVVAYVNSDSNGRGFLRANGSHSLEKLVNQAARDVVDPQTGLSALERLRSLRLVRGSAEEQKAAREREELRIGALGSGSDYTAFLDHLGIASLDLRYGGEGAGGSYHSIYDSIDHFTRFVDPGYEYAAALVRTAGRVVLRLAEADVLPFEFAGSADAIGGYVREVEKLAGELRAGTERRNRLIREKRYEAAADPKEVFVPPKPQEPVPPIDFAPLRAASERLAASAAACDGARRAWEGSGRPGPGAALDEVLRKSERALTRPEGLPRRPWYRHLVYAPGFYTGYGVKTLPGVRESLEECDWAEARRQIDAAAKALGRYADEIDRAAALLRAAD